MIPASAGSGGASRIARPPVMEAGVRRAAGFLDAFIDAELARLGLPAEAYALMGFSQGAMTVLFTGLRRAAAPRAILAFSGALIAPETLAAELANRAPVLIVHGEADDVVPVHRSRDAEAALRAAERAGGGGVCAAAGPRHRRHRAVDGRARVAAGVCRRVRLLRTWPGRRGIVSKCRFPRRSAIA